MVTKKAKLHEAFISGYKSISNDEPLRLCFGDVNILLGANGSGKSNIISFFRMLGFMMSGTFQRFVAQSGTNQGFLYYGSKTTPNISAEIELQQGKDTDSYKFVLTPASGERLIISQEEVVWKREGQERPFHSNSISSNFMESGLIGNNNETAKIIRKLISQCKAYQFHDSSVGGPLRQASLINAAQYLQSEGNNLASFLYFLKNNFSYEYNRIVSSISIIMPQFHDFYLEPIKNYVSLNWMDNGDNDYVFSADQFSDGTIRFIALATLLLQPAKTMPSVIIIDEPELGLHPYAIDQLAEMIKDASLHAQIIVATQSPLLIDHFDASSITVIEQTADHHSTIARQLNDDELKGWLDNYYLSELWEKNVIGGLPL